MPILTRVVWSSLLLARLSSANAGPCLTTGRRVQVYWPATTCDRGHILSVVTAVRKMCSLEQLKFDNRALKSLPIDVESENYVRSVAG